MTNIEGMTLREKLSEAERLLREMIDHLDNGFIPKARTLGQLLQEHGCDQASLSDISVRQQAAELIDNNRFAEHLQEKLSHLLTAIDRDVTEIQGG